MNLYVNPLFISRGTSVPVYFLLQLYSLVRRAETNETEWKVIVLGSFFVLRNLSPTLLLVLFGVCNSKHSFCYCLTCSSN